jgi:predicted nucleotidyltransferase
MRILFKAIVGSHAHGTNIEGSDQDIKGVYLQDPEDVLINGYREQVTVSDDEVYYELRRFIELCCTGNPTMLELLYSPEDCILEKEPVFDMLLEHRDSFITKACKYSFGGYALAQIEKAGGLQKKMNWEEEAKVRKEPLDFCWIIMDTGGTMPIKTYLAEIGIKSENCLLSKINHGKESYALYIMKEKGRGLQAEDGNTIRVSETPLGTKPKAFVIYTEESYSKHCKRYKEYTDWLEKRNVQRYVDIENHKQKIDGKNMLHCIRLITMGKEIAEGKGLIVRRPEREYLLSIRRGQVNLEDLLAQAETLKNDMDKAYENSPLPGKVDRGFFMKLLIKIRQKAYE